MRKLRAILALAFMMGGTAGSFAAPGPPTTTGTTTSPTCWPPPCIPVDGGVGFLIAAGAIYGAKKVYSSRKKQGRVS